MALTGCIWLLAAPLLAAEADLRRDAVVQAIEKVMPSVVNIATETLIPSNDLYDQMLRRFYGVPGRQQKTINLGSGVIADEDGYLLTNSHVVQPASRIQVKLWDGREYDAETVCATRGSDVAILRIKAKPGEKFRAIKFAPDDDLLLGETVMALGNPFGLGGSVTKGILSSKNRRPSTGDEPLNVEDWLQTDAAINPGNSGGPLVNLRGELIGLNVAVYREQDGERGMGVGFSIPVKQISAALSRYFTPEVTDLLWFGAQVKATAGSLTVAMVQPGSPAAKASVAVGDKVLRVNEEKVTGLIAFNRLVCANHDHTAGLTLQRGREQLSVEVRLMPFDEMIQKKLGVTLLEPTSQTAARLGIRAGEGLFIENTEKGGPADRAGLQRGYLLVGLDGNRANDLRSVGEVLAGKKKGEDATLDVIVPRRLGASYVEFHQGTVQIQVR